jgi:hypothetical protein
VGSPSVGSPRGTAADGEAVTQTAPPSSYTEWLPLLERFRDGDDRVLAAMQGGTIEWTNIVTERWTMRLAEALNVRLENVSRRLQTALDRSANDPFSVSRALLAARRALSPLRAVAALGCMPEEVRKHFSEEVARFAAQTQESLENSAKRIRGDSGAMLKAIRDNPLTAVEPPPSDPQPQPDSTPTSARGRRVLW